MMLWKLHNSGLAGPADATGKHLIRAKPRNRRGNRPYGLR
ncbi:hypothetical protein MA5S1212_2654 [Mycobacteroides abscessus 5S-1212]|uniref:Uncharacterized protein n=1 Tax=Mycobacteroides abscessus subsp. bolletii 1513 TaxID=1299321 RepID=X8DI57_9MYCO|nr:hypothetical protein MA5S1212_2654 [Mycobacteroides abscessus 5S-1212]EUA67736.1 hypothetical protein I540_4230 [Mycobacteroides abscessus subsp. bolletii 1513]